MMRVVYMGSPDFAVKPFKALLEAGFSVAAVFTQPDKPRGRSGRLQPTPVKEEALRAGIKVYTPKRIREPEYVQILRELNPDVIVVAAFGQIIPKEILQIPRYGCINIHASLLPKYRGAAPIQWAVINDEKESGITIMQMGEGLDTGDILMQRPVALAADETGGSLFDKLTKLGASMIPQALKALEEGELEPVAQPEDSPTAYAAMLTKEDGRIDWTGDARSIECRIRGLDPWPGTFTYLDGKQLKICGAAAAAAEPESPSEPGTVVSVGKNSFTVQTGRGQLEITQVQLEGKKRMECGAFLRGYSLKPGCVLLRER